MSNIPPPVPRPPVAPPFPTMPPLPPLSPGRDQVPTLYVIAVYAVVIFAFWNIPGARVLINPLKMLTIGWHELCHIIVAVFTGGTVTKVSIDPDQGGATHVEGGIPTLILAAGYVGSTFFGGVLIMAGFDTLISKVMSFVIGLGLVLPLVLVRDKLTILLTLCYEGLLVGFWFIDHAQALRWYCLFIGVMNILYVVWDIADDKYFRKANDSDATQFALLYPRIGAHVWAAIWIVFEIAVLIGFVFLGIVCFKRTKEEMYAEAATFLPTR
ncbi:peptidase M50B-like-domain-containing protein [Cristinia sonorae]|uniref:Peptidase M50B-like-domain-containing protein n=1 Tax=Cristinia sonorae TaxID=1940300 RepID=A0A8K0XMK5_9AGAR|nr:peptidase M50B-like-domain-containing protein [Cristinia sonorae]